MAFVYNLYSDPQCSNPAKSGKMGALYLNETLRNEANWNKSVAEIPPRFVGGKTGLHFYSRFGILQGMASTSPNTAWWSLNRVYGGYGLFAPNYTITDNKAQNDTTKVPNAFFISKHDGTSPTEEQYDGSCIVLQIHENSPYPTTEGVAAAVGVRIIQYGQNPSPSEGERTQWDYFTSSAQQLYSLSISQHNDSLYTNIGFAKITLPWGADGENINFVAVLGNFDDNGEFQPTNTGYTGCIMLFPEELWQDTETIPDPYVGPVSKESAETSFVPTRERYRDSVEGREAVFDTNPALLDPLGLGDQNSQVKLLWQLQGQYQLMVASIFRGTSDSFLGTLGDYGQMLTSAQHKRDKDEADIMSKGILSCKLVPAVLSGNVRTNNSWQDPTICGFRWQGSNLNTGITGGQICNKNISIQGWPTYYPTRWFNSFLDYEPHTSVMLYVPFCGTVRIDPSALYNKGIAIVTFCDVITGLLSVDVHLIDTDGRDYIYTTLQGNCGIDLPVIGAGSSAGQGIAKIAGGIAGLANNKDITGNIFKTMEGLNAVDKSTPVGHFSNANMAPYFSPRQAYLMFCVPKPANPKKFITLYGGESNVSGPLSQFKGYLEVSAVDLGTTTATEAEKEEIIRLMKAGVFNGVYTNDGEVT